MAVYTEVAAEDLENFIGGFGIGRLRSCKGIAEGVENSNFLVQTEKGAYILTLYEKRVAAEDLPFFLGLMNHLTARAIPCPTPIPDASGALLGELAGRPAALVSFLDGLSVRRPTVAHCAEVGKAMALLHLAARDFELVRENALGPAGWRALAGEIGAAADTISLGLSKIIADELATLEACWPQGLPEGVIHADLFPDNVFFMDGALSGIFDFYFACNDMLAYDLAIALNAWCFEADGAFNVTKARALLSGYRAARKLEPEEIEALPCLARGAALRFLLTRVFDWLHTPADALVHPKDPMEYVKRLRFHQGVTTAAQYGLDA